jgi:addiction module HigA family antidote
MTSKSATITDPGTDPGAGTARLPPVHPGEVLRHEFMEPLGLSAGALARRIGVPANRVSEIAAGRRSVSGDTALRLAAAFGTSPEFWMNLQKTWELERARDGFDAVIDRVA